jgi:hypothetical protein
VGILLLRLGLRLLLMVLLLECWRHKRPHEKKLSYVLTPRLWFCQLTAVEGHSCSIDCGWVVGLAEHQAASASILPGQ